MSASAAPAWTTLADVRAHLLKLWERGKILRNVVSGEALFPLTIPSKRPTSAQLREHFNAARDWLATLRAEPRLRVELVDRKHPVFGLNQSPRAIWVDSLDAALSFIGKTPDYRRFVTLLYYTRSTAPALLPWLAKRPLRALEHAPSWPLLLDVVCRLQAAPRPGVFLRELDIPGVHSKFIEVHRALLAELLDAALPAESIDPLASSTQQFAQRYGFLDKPERVRLRILDPAQQLLPGPPIQDIQLDARTFAALRPTVGRIFITENEINFLSFPALPDSMVLFGAGYGFAALRGADWLQQCSVHYWGDIDTHGFAILDQLRALLPHAQSLLMDRQTLLQHRDNWVQEERPTRRELMRLDDVETALYAALCANQLGDNIRLEQERIDTAWVQRAIAGLVLDPSTT